MINVEFDALQFKNGFWSAKPFPHLIIDNFLQPSIASGILTSFPSIEEKSWTPYLHFNEIKYGFSKSESFPPEIQQFIFFLHSDEFCNQLSILAGSTVFPDPLLIGGGLHQTFRNGFLNMHTDFSHHPHNKRWKRKLNLLFYLNEEWSEQYNGNLELWDQGLNKCVTEIAPLFNRLVIFLTDENSLHGVPKRINCRKDESRKSIALYYYEETSDTDYTSTRYSYKTGKLWYRLAVKTENILLSIFTTFRFWFKIKH